MRIRRLANNILQIKIADEDKKSADEEAGG
jgi:hypothetical protein